MAVEPSPAASACECLLKRAHPEHGANTWEGLSAELQSTAKPSLFCV